MLQYLRLPPALVVWLLAGGWWQNVTSATLHLLPLVMHCNWMITWEKQNIPILSIYSNCLIVGWLNLWKPPLHCTQCYPGHGGSQVLWLPCWAIITWYHESQIATPDCSAVLVPVCVNIMTGSGCPHCPPSWWPWWPTSTAASTWPCASCQCGGQGPVMVSQVSLLVS